MPMLLEPLDLHGYLLADAMTRFVQGYNRVLVRCRDGELRGLEVIHGKGKGDSQGVIRDALREYLRGQGKRIKGFDAQLALRGADYLLDGCGTLAYMHGEDIDRNGGKTVVVPRQRISIPHDWLRYR